MGEKENQNQNMSAEEAEYSAQQTDTKTFDWEGDPEQSEPSFAGAQLLLDAKRFTDFDFCAPYLRVGYAPGIMPGKWFSRWHQRFDAFYPLKEFALTEKSAIDGLETQLLTASGEKDQQAADQLLHMALLRPDQEPAALDTQKYHCITLYREQQVVILPIDHVLTLLDSVPLEELSEEFLLQEPASVPEWAHISESYRQQNPKKLPDMRDTKDAVELVAAGVGLLIAPMSIARFYHRKDLTYRPVDGLAEQPVALVWKKEPREESFEQVIQDFIGVCRGRTASSDRGSETVQIARQKAARAKEKEKAERRAKNSRREQADKKRKNAQKNGNARQHAHQSKRSAAQRSKKR